MRPNYGILGFQLYKLDSFWVQGLDLQIRGHKMCSTKPEVVNVTRSFGDPVQVESQVMSEW